MIDYTTFNALKDRMAAKFPILLGGYLKDGKNYLETIEVQLPDGDLDSLINAAHSLKSASGLLGVVDVHKAAETLEYAGKDLLGSGAADFESLRPLFVALQTAFSAAAGELQDLLPTD